MNGEPIIESSSIFQLIAYIVVLFLMEASDQVAAGERINLPSLLFKVSFDRSLSADRTAGDPD